MGLFVMLRHAHMDVHRQGVIDRLSSELVGAIDVSGHHIVARRGILMRHFNTFIRLAVAVGPIHSVDVIIGLNSHVNAFVNAHVQAMMIELTPLTVDNQFLLQADYIGTHTISITTCLTEAIDMGYQSPYTRKMVDTM